MTQKQTTRKTKQSNNVTRFALSLLVLRPDMPLGLVVVLPIRDPAFFWPLRLPINRCSGYPTSRHSRCKNSCGLKTVRCHGVSVPRAPGCGVRQTVLWVSGVKILSNCWVSAAETWRSTPYRCVPGAGRSRWPKGFAYGGMDGTLALLTDVDKRIVATEMASYSPSKGGTHNCCAVQMRENAQEASVA